MYHLTQTMPWIKMCSHFREITNILEKKNSLETNTGSKATEDLKIIFTPPKFEER
jgi:hypothetical protein